MVAAHAAVFIVLLVMVAMQSFELQVYKRGKWEYDSYFNDRESALDEAHRMVDTTRHGGVRVLADKYDENSNGSACDVIFSRMLKTHAPVKNGKAVLLADWREQASRNTGSTRNGAQADFRQTSRPRRAAEQKSFPVLGMVAMALAMLAIGIGAIIWMGGFIQI